jgi:hypothetical protein
VLSSIELVRELVIITTTIISGLSESKNCYHRSLIPLPPTSSIPFWLFSSLLATYQLHQIGVNATKLKNCVESEHHNFSL